MKKENLWEMAIIDFSNWLEAWLVSAKQNITKQLQEPYDKVAYNLTGL